MKKKLEEKFKDVQIDETDLIAIEEAFAEDEEELIEYYRSLRFGILEEEGSTSPYGPPDGCSVGCPYF